MHPRCLQSFDSCVDVVDAGPRGGFLPRDHLLGKPGLVTQPARQADQRRSFPSHSFTINDLGRMRRLNVKLLVSLVVGLLVLVVGVHVIHGIQIDRNAGVLFCARRSRRKRRRSRRQRMATVL